MKVKVNKFIILRSFITCRRAVSKLHHNQNWTHSLAIICRTFKTKNLFPYIQWNLLHENHLSMRTSNNENVKTKKQNQVEVRKTAQTGLRQELAQTEFRHSTGKMPLVVGAEVPGPVIATCGCVVELSYHRSTASLKKHIFTNLKSNIDACGKASHRTNLAECSRQNVNKVTMNSLTNAVVKCVAHDSRPSRSDTATGCFKRVPMHKLLDGNILSLQKIKENSGTLNVWLIVMNLNCLL